MLVILQDCSRWLQGFTIPLHVQKHAIRLVKEALDIAGVSPSDIACIAYTKVSPAPESTYTSSLHSSKLLLPRLSRYYKHFDVGT